MKWVLRPPIYSMGLYRISKYVEATYLLVNQRKKKKKKKRDLILKCPQAIYYAWNTHMQMIITQCDSKDNMCLCVCVCIK